MTQEERRKIERLNRYQRISEQVEHLKDKVEELETQLEGVGAQCLDGMPKGGSGTDKERLINEIDDLKTHIIKQTIKSIKEQFYIYEAIDKLNDIVLALIIQYRYIDGMEFKDIAMKMCYSERQVYRFHILALNELDI